MLRACPRSANLKPPRKPFDFRSSFSSYTSRRNYPILRMFTETRTWLQEAGELAGSERRAEVAARFVQESPFARFEFLGARSGMLDAAMRDLQTAERLLEDPAADAAVSQR